MGLGTGTLGTGSLAGYAPSIRPVVSNVGPTGTVASSDLTVTWDYSSALGRPQFSYRVQLRTADGTGVLLDTFTVVSSTPSAELTYVLTAGGSYQIWVYASDVLDTSEVATSVITVAPATVPEYDPERAVGSVFEVGINGVGFMLADRPEGDLQYQSRVINLDPPRFATGDTPFSQAIERYTLIGWSSWVNGAGVRHNVPGEFDKFFWDSEGVNPFEPNQLSLLPASAISVGADYADADMVVAHDQLFVLTNTNEITQQGTPGGAQTVFTVAAAGTITGMASDGDYWYVTDGANVYRNNTSVDPGAAWSTENADLIEWISDRIAVAVKNGSSTTPNELKTISEDGLTATSRAILPAGTTIRSITAGNGYVWFCGDRYQRSVVWAWQLGSNDAAFVSFELPAGQVATSLGFYQGNVMVRAAEKKVSGTRAVIYRCAQSDGRLVPARLTDIDGTVDHSLGDFAGDDRFIAFSWKGMTENGRSGIGVLDLSSGGWCKHLYAPSNDASGDVRAITSWKGLFVYLVTGYGVVYETSTALASGWVRTWTTDLSSTLVKILDRLEVVTDPLPATGAAVELSYSTDAGLSYSAVSASVTTPGATSATSTPAVAASSIGVKVTLTAGVSSPVVRAIVARVHPLAVTDEILILPLDLAPRRKGLNGHEIKSSPSRSLSFVKGLAGTRVRLQDVDWPTTRTTSVWEVIDLTVRTTGLYDRQLNRRVDSPIAVLTLRRSLT